MSLTFNNLGAPFLSIPMLALALVSGIFFETITQFYLLDILLVWGTAQLMLGAGGIVVFQDIAKKATNDVPATYGIVASLTMCAIGLIELAQEYLARTGVTASALTPYMVLIWAIVFPAAIALLMLWTSIDLASVRDEPMKRQRNRVRR